MKSDKTELQCVTFSLGRETFAVPVEVVREILEHEDAFRIPYGPDYLLGLRNVRGHGVPVIDLRRKLGMDVSARTADTRLLVLDIEIRGRQLALGLVADKVHEVTPFRRDQIERAPDIGVTWRSDYIAGVVRRDDGFVVIVDLMRLFSDDSDVIASAIPGSSGDGMPLSASN
jgi:purine-binding chemotaxis protein CheW